MDKGGIQKKIGKRTRKLITMNNSRDDSEKRYVSKKEGRKELPSIEDGVDESVQRHDDYIKNNKGKLNTVTISNSRIMRTNRKTNTWRKMGRKQRNG